LLTCGGNGGAIISKDKSLIREVKNIREYDQKSIKKLHFNFTLNEIGAAIGISQLNKIDSFIKNRDKLFNTYLQNHIELLQTDNSLIKSVKFRAIHITKHPKKLSKFLLSKKIETIIPYTINELITKDQSMKNSLNFSQNTISLPMHLNLSISNVEFISKQIQKYYKKFPNDRFN